MGTSDVEEFERIAAGFGVEGSTALQRSLQVNPPDSAVHSPAALTFRRKRDIELPWERLGRRDGSTALRQHFESSWQLEDVAGLWLDGKKGLLADPTRLRAVQPSPPTLFRTNFEKPGLNEPVVRGFAVRHGTSGRWYLLVEGVEGALSPEDFSSFERYELAWSKVDGVELLFERAEDAGRFYTEFQEIDLRPALIARRFEELSLLQGFTQAVKASVSAATTRLIDRIASTSMSGEELQSLQQRVLRLEMEDYDVRRQIDRLAADAARLGFLLFNEAVERQVTGYDGKPLQLRKGRLYTTSRRTATWTEYISVKPHWWSSRRLVAVAQEKIVDAYQEVDLLKDVVNDKRSAWLREGKSVFIFEKTPAGFVATDGRTLGQVMALCRHDEGFRRQCVVLLPVHEESMTGQRVLTKYSVFLRPLPGIVPTGTPRLALTESLSYRTAWVGTHLGELVSSINLAPGEERQVKITKKFEQESTVTRSSTSIFEVSRSESSDLSTEMENQTRREQEHSSTMQFSASASGSYLGCTAEASASGGTSTSLKDFSQAINKVAKKASQAVNQQNKEEVSVSTSSRTTVSNSDETAATLRNINQGRSLNLMFHRLYNRFEGGLYLDGLGFEVLSGVEAIAGSGVHEAQAFGLDDLPRVVESLHSAGLGTTWSRPAFARELATCIRALLEREYASPLPAPARRGRPGAPQGAAGLLGAAPPVPRQADGEGAGTSVQLLHLPGVRPAAAPGSVMLMAEGPAAAASQGGEPPASVRGDDDSDVDAVTDSLRRATLDSDSPMVEQVLLVPAAGLYLDTVVGAQPSTEPYSERMREEEVRMRAAEVFVKATEGLCNQARAAARTARKEDGTNAITGLLAGPDQRTLALSLRRPLPPGQWSLQLDGQPCQRLDPSCAGPYLLTIGWDQPQPWLQQPGFAARIALVDALTGSQVLAVGDLSTAGCAGLVP